MIRVNQSVLIFRIAKDFLRTFWVWLVAILFLNGYKAPSVLTGLLVLLMFALPAVIGYIGFRNTGYKETDQSITLNQGFLSLISQTFPYTKITNVRFSQSLSERLFGVGDLVIDQEDSEFRWQSVDSKSAQVVIDKIAAKSNVQPTVKTK